jgi:hypothetical protein
MFGLAAAELTDEQEVLCRVCVTLHKHHLLTLKKPLAGSNPAKRFL